MDMNIRTVTPDDLDAVCRVENRCFPAAEAATREAFRTRIALFPERFLVAEAPTAGIVGLINGCCTDTPVLGDELYEPDCPHSLQNPWQTVFGLAVDPGLSASGHRHMAHGSPGSPGQGRRTIGRDPHLQKGENRVL